MYRRPYDLFRLYQGAGLEGSQAADIGETGGILASLTSRQETERVRGKLLAQALQEHKLQANQLSAADTDLAGKFMNQAKRPGTGGGGFFGDIGDVFSNLGSDIVHATKGIPISLFETGKAIGQDTLSALGQSLGQGTDLGGKGSEVLKDVVKPTVDQYKYYYAGEGAPKGSTFWERFSEHPLQLGLDVATVASLGLGAAARAGLTPALTRTAGRRPLVLGEGAEIPRTYSVRPLRNLGQRAVDPLENVIPAFGRFRTSRGMRRMQREESSRELAGEAAAVRSAITPLVQTSKDLSYEEGVALDYALRGWNTPEKIQGTRDMFQASLRNDLPEGANVIDFERIFNTPEDAHKFVEYKANLPKSVEDLILNPTPRMVEAARARQESVASGFERMGVTPEEAAARTQRPQNILAEFMRGREGGEEGDIGPEGGPPGGEPPQGPPPPEPPPAPRDLQPDDHEAIARALQSFKGDFEAFKQRILDAQPGDHIWDELKSVIESILVNRYPSGRIPNKFTGEMDWNDAINAIHGEIPDYMAGDLDVPLDTWQDLIGEVLDQAQFFETSDPNALIGLNEEGNIESQSIPEVPDTPQSLFEQWGMGDQVDIPEIPDTPGAFFAQMGDQPPPVSMEDFTQGRGPFGSKSDAALEDFDQWLREEGLDPESVKQDPETYERLKGMQAEGFMSWDTIDDLRAEQDLAQMSDQEFQDAYGYTKEEWQSDNFGEEPPSGGGPPETTQPDAFGAPEGYPIEPTWTPDQLARGFKEEKLGWLARMASDRPDTFFARAKRDRRITPGGVTSSNLFEPSGDAFLREPGPEALMSGATRMDPKAFVEHVARRERDITAQAFDQRVVGQVAAKNENGEPTRFTTQGEVEKALGHNWVLIHDQFPIRWFVGETEFLRDTINKLQEMQDMGIPTTDANVMHELEKLADDHASEFVRKAFGARKIDGVAVPRNFFEYQKRIVQATDPFDHGVGRVYARYIHRWRALTLAYMPRWALNTAVGSFLLNMVKGVDPRYYRKARQLRSGKITGENFFAQPASAGVELGNITGMEYLEPGMHGVGGAIERQTGAKVTGFGERIVEKVQQIEDYFRRASFVQSLDKVEKQKFREMGVTLENFERRKGVMRDDEYLAEILNDPELVQVAIDDLNRFSYNFASLGPYERRYVRMAIPFWGWYKFISKFAYRLPVEYPGRANLIANIGMLGNMSQEEYGKFPEWLRGFIPLGTTDKGELTYLSTLGINPLGQFFNPLGPQGMVQGAVSAGQASPPIQALLSSMGVDTLRGGSVPISPQEGVGPDFFGSWINVNKGEETSPMVEGAFRRGLMGLLRAAPQFRMAEERLAGGRPVYPESIPFISERPMPVRPGTMRDTSILAALGQTLGVYPKHFDLRAYQRLLPERVKYARARNKTQLRKLRQSLLKP